MRPALDDFGCIQENRSMNMANNTCDCDQAYGNNRDREMELMNSCELRSRGGGYIPLFS